ncbi:MAG: acyl carrier protein [Sphingomonadales bacterium]|nr:MAG: acyl carrier protein [Sphingomonadales bacterium]
MTDDVFDRLTGVIAAYNKKGIPLEATTRFATDLEFDSLTVMDLVAAIEDEFDITLPLNRLPDLETVGDVANAVREIRAR